MHAHDYVFYTMLPRASTNQASTSYRTNFWGQVNTAARSIWRERPHQNSVNILSGHLHNVISRDMIIRPCCTCPQLSCELPARYNCFSSPTTIILFNSDANDQLPYIQAFVKKVTTSAGENLPLLQATLEHRCMSSAGIPGYISRSGIKIFPRAWVVSHASMNGKPSCHTWWQVISSIAAISQF